MITVAKEQKPEGLVIKMTGTIEEGLDFEKLIGKVPAKIIINCRGVSRINSVGVKAWIKYFQTHQQAKVQMTLAECSTAIVEQINLISNFTCGAKIESIMLPFACQKCGTELQGLFKIEAIKKMNGNVPNLKCTKCGAAEAAFDDIPEEYFNFLQNA